MYLHSQIQAFRQAKMYMNIHGPISHYWKWNYARGKREYISYASLQFPWFLRGTNLVFFFHNLKQLMICNFTSFHFHKIHDIFLWNILYYFLFILLNAQFFNPLNFKNGFMSKVSKVKGFYIVCRHQRDQRYTYYS